MFFEKVVPEGWIHKQYVLHRAVYLQKEIPVPFRNCKIERLFRENFYYFKIRRDIVTGYKGSRDRTFFQCHDQPFCCIKIDQVDSYPGVAEASFQYLPVP
ncbi:hypothetical protein SDC9_157302 [bioreactor metagenome]|uniref:Uncharacterized protein n=1 Tax=bioreactor metagenome TaxID=1076179 RepID=A0A645F9K9_9ZZZZ